MQIRRHPSGAGVPALSGHGETEAAFDDAGSGGAPRGRRGDDPDGFGAPVRDEIADVTGDSADRRR